MSLKKIDEIVQKKPYLKLYEFILGKGNFNLKQAKEKNEFYIEYLEKNLSSPIAPKKSAERLVSSYPNYENQIVFLLGLGNPHLISEINSRLKENQILIYIDFYEENFPLLWNEFLTDAMDVAGRHLFLGESKLSLLWNYLESLPVEKIDGIKILKNQPSIELNKEFYLGVEEKIRKLFSSKMSDLLTKFEFDRIWGKNSFQNILQSNELDKKIFPIKDLFFQFANIPAVLVSAGPSLRSQIPILKKIREKVFLFSCDTSLKVLLKFGILPDAVMTLDAQTHSYFHFLGEELSEIPLFADIVTSPSLLRNFKFRSIVFSMTGKYQVLANGKSYVEKTAGGDLVESFFGELGYVQSGGSVATTAFDILRNLGFSPIFLVGQDLAYTGREIHSTGTHHNEKWLTVLNRKKSLEKINEEVVRKRETLKVKSADGKEVLSDFILTLYKTWFEESMKNQILEVYNISEKGAYIENLKNINLTEAEKIFESFPAHSFPWRKKNPWSLRESNFLDLNKSIGLKDFFSSEVHLFETIKNFSSDEILKFLNESLLLKDILRKTKVYLARNQNLPDEKKKEILVESIQREINYLKRFFTF
jgi:hypothetical protein